MPMNFYQRSALAIAVTACFPAAGHAAGVARVDFAVGNVTAVAPNGRTRGLTRGSEIEVGDTVNTQQGRAQLRFQDGAYMSLQPETSFKIDEFRFAEQGAGKDGIAMSLLKGGMRTITGLIGRANRQNYKFRTAVATIGIRGTEYAVRYTNSIEVFCAGGAIEVQNEGGTLILGSGQGGFVPNAKQEPQRTEERPFLPPTAASGSEEPQEELAAPVNPIQQSQPPVLLTGKITANWAAARQTSVNAFTNVLVEFDGTGTIIGMDDGSGTTLIGTSTSIRDGTDGIISWGRWTNGVTGGTGIYGGVDTRAAPLHGVAGLPTPNMPTGSASYSMIGATPPSCAFACATTVNSSSLFVTFDTNRVDMSLDITVNGTQYTTTNPALLTINGSGFSGTGSLSGGFCGGASLLAKGFFAGDAAARAGLAYHLGTPNEQVNGAIAYQKLGGGL
jgi:hypothetical protein